MLSFFSLKMWPQTSLAPNSVYGKAFFEVRSSAWLRHSNPRAIGQC
ncbi:MULTISPECIES: hypothetical protein [unclassified Microcoleus]